MKSFLFCLISLSAASSFASPAGELPDVIGCHHAIYSKYQDHKTWEFTPDQATPIAIIHPRKVTETTLVNGKKKKTTRNANDVYIYTNKSIVVAKDVPVGKTFITEVDNDGKKVRRQMSLSKDDELEIQIQDTTESQGLVPTTTVTDDQSLAILKTDLAREIKGVQKHYENKNFPKDTMDALNACAKVDSPAVQQSLNSANKYFQDLIKNPKKYEDKSSGTAT